MLMGSACAPRKRRRRCVRSSRSTTPMSRNSRGKFTQIERYRLSGRGPVLVEGRSIGHRIGAGKARVVRGIDQMNQFQAGDVLVADMTDPDWEPIMKRASAIVTNRGGRTCH